jgi:hypothetical protein
MGATSSKLSSPSPDRVLQTMSGDVWAHADRLVDCYVAERFGGRVAMRAHFGGQPLRVLTFWADAIRWTHRYAFDTYKLLFGHLNKHENAVHVRFLC